MSSDASKSEQPPRLRDLASRLEALDELLNTLTDVLDIRAVFHQVSKAVQPVLPHDIMGVVEVNEAGDRLKLYAGTGPAQNMPDYEAPAPDPEMVKKWEAIVIDDVQTHIFFQSGPAIEAGMKPVLTAPIRFGGRARAAVNFFSRSIPRELYNSKIAVRELEILLKDPNYAERAAVIGKRVRTETGLSTAGQLIEGLLS